MFFFCFVLIAASRVLLTAHVGQTLNKIVFGQRQFIKAIPVCFLLLNSQTPFCCNGSCGLLLATISMFSIFQRRPTLVL